MTPLIIVAGGVISQVRPNPDTLQELAQRRYNLGVFIFIKKVTKGVVMFSKNINELNRQAWLKKTLAALPAGARILYFKLRGHKRAEDLACFGWHCVGVKAK